MIFYLPYCTIPVLVFPKTVFDLFGLQKHLDEAKKILTTVATIPEDKMARKDNIDDVMSAYQSFINNFKDQLK